MPSKELALKKLSDLEKTYHSAPSVFAFSDFMRIYITVDDLAEAVKALEKQIPRKPIEDGYFDRPCVCPECGQEFGFNSGFKYCENCGQAIDWSDGE